MSQATISALNHWRQWFKNHFPLVFLIALAAVFRFAAISTLPGGLFPDEAANGLDINSILKGEHQPFYERGNGREALFFYLLTPSVLLFGRTPFAHHLVSAALGVMVVWLTYLLIKRWFGPRMAFVAAFLTAVSSWYVTMSRTAFRANTAPIFALLFFYFSTRVVQSKSRKDYWWSAVLAGVSFGMGFYTYISYRMMVPILFFAAIALLIWDFKSTNRFALLKQYWRAILAGIASALAALSWLIIFFVKHPEWLVGRSGQVSIFSDSLNNGDVIGTFLAVLRDTFLGFITYGDANWRHNVSGYPFLSYLVAPLFVVGLLYLLVQSVIFVLNLWKKSQPAKNINLKRLPFFILLLWFGFMLVPEVLTAEGIPHGLRLIGIIPVVFIIPALFVEEILTQLPHEAAKRSRVRNSVVALALTLFLGAEAVYGANLYFNVAANSPGYYEAFRSDLTTVSQYLNARNNKNSTYLVLDLFSEQTVKYMTTENNQPYLSVDPASFEVVDTSPPHARHGRMNLKRGDQVVFTQSTIFDTTRFERTYPSVKLIKSEKNKFGQTIMMVYERQ